ncbi:hypothetical protein [Paludibacterium yongneupense]|uniref:hypothetical protein n=1 Tax=Paludibacterium yongneupense TaxID=400061 RepID=UPI0003F529D1|nr:hypothetical protein [Paludibacterium yongneupense]
MIPESWYGPLFIGGGVLMLVLGFTRRRDVPGAVFSRYSRLAIGVVMIAYGVLQMLGVAK